jgi:hypothetical protein
MLASYHRVGMSLRADRTPLGASRKRARPLAQFSLARRTHAAPTRVRHRPARLSLPACLSQTVYNEQSICDRETSLLLSMALLSLSTMLTLASLSCSSLLHLTSLLHRRAIVLTHRPRFLCSFAASSLAARSRASLLSSRSTIRNPRKSTRI